MIWAGLICPSAPLLLLRGAAVFIFSLLPILKENSLNPYGNFVLRNTAWSPEVKEGHCHLSNDQGSSGHANKSVLSLDIASE